MEGTNCCIHQRQSHWARSWNAVRRRFLHLNGQRNWPVDQGKITWLMMSPFCLCVILSKAAGFSWRRITISPRYFVKFSTSFRHTKVFYTILHFHLTIGGSYNYHCLSATRQVIPSVLLKLQTLQFPHPPSQDLLLKLRPFSHRIAEVLNAVANCCSL